MFSFLIAPFALTLLLKIDLDGVSLIILSVDKQGPIYT